MTEITHSKPWLTPEDEAAVQNVLRGGMLAQGAITREFEQRMAVWLGAADGIATGSGSAALELALWALGCAAGGEVILPTYVCRAVIEAVVATGVQPVLCDAGPDWVVGREQVAPHMTGRTRALVVPHLYGIFADVASLQQLGPPVIVDAAQALDREHLGLRHAALTILSFHPTKCLTTGEGGMVLGQDAALLARVRAGRDGGAAAPRRQFAPLSDLASALGLSQLKRYSVFLARRRELAAQYLSRLTGIPGPDLAWHGRRATMYFRLPMHIAGGCYRYQAAFAARGIHVRRGVDELLHRSLGLPDKGYPTATAHWHDTLSLPLYPSLTPAELERCLQAIKEIFPTHA